MANSLATTAVVAKEALAILENMLGFSSNVNTDWQDEFESNMSRGYAPGATISIKRPPRYTYRAGRVSVPQATTETTTPLTLSQGGCDLSFTTQERTLSLSQVEKKLQAAVATVANEIDRQGLLMAYQNTFNALNTTGAVPNTQALALAAVTGINRRLDEMGAPRDKQRSLCLNPSMNASFITGFAGLFNGQAQISKQYGSGMMVDSLGLSYMMDQNVAVHTNGAGTASNVSGANQTGSSITVAATGSGTIAKGTVVTFVGCNAVNPQNRSDTGTLAQFVITADVLQGATTLPISPAIVTSGAFQNVTASPTNSQAFVIWGAASTAYSQSIGYHRDAFTLAAVPLWQPPGGKGVIGSSQVTSDNNISIRVIDFYDGVNDAAIRRLDVLFGWASTYPELACRYYSV